MEKEFILTSSEFAKLIGISDESLRSRRRRGLYKGMYIRKSFSYAWKKPAPNHSAVAALHGHLAPDASGLSAQASIANIQDAKTKNRGPRKNKNSRKHYQELVSGNQGTETKYPNKAFELANEFKIVTKAQKKISAAAAEEITPELIELAQEKHRQKILAKMKEPFLPQADKEYLQDLKKVVQQDERMRQEERSGKWHDVLNPDNDIPKKVKKPFYYG